MPLNIEQKKDVVKELNVFATESVSGAIAEYSGLSVQDMTLLRNQARESDIYLKVVKNTLSKRAFEETDFRCLIDDLNGPIIIALSKEDLASPARLFKNFSKLEIFVLLVVCQSLPPKRLSPKRTKIIAPYIQ